MDHPLLADPVISEVDIYLHAGWRFYGFRSAGFYVAAASRGNRMHQWKSSVSAVDAYDKLLTSMEFF